MMADLPSGSVCAFGGKKVKKGKDLNGDYELSNSEVTTHYTLCNGSEEAHYSLGSNGGSVGGSTGDSTGDGSAGGELIPHGQNELVVTVTEPPGAHCQQGGAKLQVGQDENNNQLLDEDEIEHERTVYVCSDLVVPVLTELAAVVSPVSQDSASYQFHASEAGTLSYGGRCSAVPQVIRAGNHSITFISLTEGVHTDCEIQLEDFSGNVSQPLSVSDFIVDTQAPLLTLVSNVPLTPAGNMVTFIFNANESGVIHYLGPCSASTVQAHVGDNSISLNPLNDGFYRHCDIQLEDGAGNFSNTLMIDDFYVGWHNIVSLNDSGVIDCANYALTDGGSYAVTGNGNHANGLDCVSLPTAATLSSDGYDTDGNIVRAGQDAHYGRDVSDGDNSDGALGFSFSKLDASGNTLSSTALNWACVRDEVTGLVWEKKTTSGLQSKDSTYSWYDSNWATNGGGSGLSDAGVCSGGTGCDTEKYTYDLNALNNGSGLCGFSDWRMPSRRELLSIIDYSASYPAIDINYFPNTQSNEHWSNASFSSVGAWSVGFHAGNVTPVNRLSALAKFPIRLVRGSWF